MSQKNAKRIRKIEGKVDALQLKFDEAMARASYESDCRERAQRKASNDRQMRRELEAENVARIWKAVAIGALVAAIIVEIIAIAAVHAKAIEPVPQEAAPANELTIIEPKTPTLAQDDAKSTPIFVTSLEKIMVSEKVDTKIYNVPLDAETQQLLREACEESGIDMSLALAVIWEETDYRNIIGDDGASFGYMQVQKKWHEDRMARLGVTDLMDPASNFRTGCDYLAELLEIYPLANALAFYNSGDPALRPYCERVMDYMEALEGGGV